MSFGPRVSLAVHISSAAECRYTRGHFSGEHLLLFSIGRVPERALTKLSMIRLALERQKFESLPFQL